MNKINVNGKILKDDQPVAQKDHRGLKYGDGLFESIRMMDGKMPLLPDHLRRLRRGMKFLNFDLPKYYNTQFFRKEIIRITEKNLNARIRISVFRSPGGLYTPASNQPIYLIEYQPLKLNNWQWNKQGLAVRICPTVQLPVTSWSDLKTTNSLPYILAAQWKKSQNLDDCILLNQSGQIAEASSANIFYFKNNLLFTPSDKSGAIHGVLRRHLVRLAKKQNLKITKKSVSPEDLLSADEIFLTNAIQGIRWIRKLENKNFSNKKTKIVFKWLCNY